MKKLFYLSVTALSTLVLLGCSHESNNINENTHNIKTESVKKTSSEKKERKETLKENEISIANTSETSASQDSWTSEVVMSSRKNSNKVVDNTSVSSSQQKSTTQVTPATQAPTPVTQQQLTQAQLAAIAANYMGKTDSALVVHNMGTYNAVSNSEGNLLFAYSVASGNNLKVGGFGDSPWNSVNGGEVMHQAQQNGTSASINQLAKNITFVQGY